MFHSPSCQKIVYLFVMCYLTKQLHLITVRASIAGWSSLVARRAHNPKVRGSNPLPATTLS